MKPTPLLLAAAAAVLFPRLAIADEITYRDADTCERTTVRAEEIVSETWTEIQYTERKRGPTKSVPTHLVLEIRRTDAEAGPGKDLMNAIQEVERGNFAEARGALGDISGGGYSMDLASGQRKYRNFRENDPPGRNQRPPWTAEYAHFYYAKALYLEGAARKDRDLLREAYLALEDQRVPGSSDQTTGGFLERFKGGNSRWYAEAMLLKAKALLGLGQTDDAAKAFKELSDKALGLPIGVRWYYEALVGIGDIAEAQGKLLDAQNRYVDAANAVRSLLEQETRGCILKEMGRYFSLARMRAAAVLLVQAEKNRSPAEFSALRTFIQEGTPQSLARTYRTLPKPQLDALLAGALDPNVQAVAQNGVGLAYLNEKNYEEAILAFRSVEVKYFREPEEHARALYYLSQAADGAAKAARGAEAKALYQSLREEALKRLRAEHPESKWGR